MSEGTWRTGASWTAKDPQASPLTTIVHIGAGEPDDQGRRVDDVLVGALPRGSAERLVELVNGAPDPERTAAFIAAVIESEMARVGARAVKLARGHVSRSKDAGEDG